MRNRTKFIAALALLTLPMAPVAVTSVADATPGPTCASSQRKIDKVRTWEYNTPFFKDPDQGLLYRDDAVHMIRFKLIADMRYTLCPRGALVDLIKPRSIRYCYGVVNDGDGGDQNTFQLFEGWTLNAEAEDDFRSVNPPAKKIPEEGRSNCVRQYISTDEQKWLRRDQEPGYEVKATLNINLKSDRSWMMKSKNAEGNWIAYRFFKPSHDPNAVAGGYWYTGTGRINY